MFERKRRWKRFHFHGKFLVCVFNKMCFNWAINKRFCFNLNNSILPYSRVSKIYHGEYGNLPKHQIFKHRYYEKSHEIVFGSVSKGDLIGEVYVCKERISENYVDMFWNRESGNSIYAHYNVKENTFISGGAPCQQIVFDSYKFWINILISSTSYI